MKHFTKTMFSIIIISAIILPVPLIIAAETDSDGDGVYDAYDYCPNEAYIEVQGFNSEIGHVGGCHPDRVFNDYDGDGWSNDIDDCIVNPGSDENAGCPHVTANDSDGDGVLNADDNCPAEAGGEFYGGCPDDAGDIDNDDWYGLFDNCPVQFGVDAYGGCPDPADTTPAPVANFTVSPLSGYEPIFAVATDTSSNNPEAWEWVYKHVGTGFTSTKNTRNLEFLVTSAKTGDWEITLTVWNSGGTDTITKIINFNSYPYPDEDPHNGTLPIANFEADVTSGPAPLVVTFTNTSEYGTTYEWDTNGDGVFQSTPFRDNWVNFLSPGTYTVSLRVTNSAGSDTETKINYITVTNGTEPALPIANFAADTTSGTAPLTVHFNNLSTNATSWTWDFHNDNIAESNLQHPTYTYTEPGTYSVRLYAANTSGTDTEIKIFYITVTEAIIEPPDVDNATVVYRFFNKKNGAHLYTISTIERDTVMQLTSEWTYEGEKFYVLTAPAEGTVPVYRFFNSENGAHLYTISEDEKTTILNTLPKFHYEGIKFHVYKDEGSDTKPVHRFFNSQNGAHLYTISEDEKNTIMNTLPHFQYEGVKYYVL